MTFFFFKKSTSNTMLKKKKKDSRQWMILSGNKERNTFLDAQEKMNKNLKEDVGYRYICFKY